MGKVRIRVNYTNNRTGFAEICNSEGDIEPTNEISLLAIKESMAISAAEMDAGHSDIQLINYVIDFE